MKSFIAQSDSMGDGWTDVDATVNRWNKFIASVLDTESARLMKLGTWEANEEAANLQYDAEWAWTEFCGRSGGESDEMAEIIGNELKKRIGINY